MRSANVVGAGPNGLACAITLAQAGIDVTVYEANARVGGACSTAEVTLPGFRHDLGASAFPMGAASPFFRSLDLGQYGFRWIHPELALAHPLDGGEAVGLPRSLDLMSEELGERDGASWSRLFGPLVREWERLVPEILTPVLHVPKHPVTLGRFGLPAMFPAEMLARTLFQGERARALFAGCAAHSVMPLSSVLSASVGLVLGAAGHAVGWPVAEGGSQSLSNALAAHLGVLGGRIETGVRVESLSQMRAADAIFFDTSVKAVEQVAGSRLSAGYRKALQGFRRGPGVFKIDWALSGPIPWAAETCRRAGTVHVGGTLEEIAAAELAAFEGRHADRPFVLVVQPSVFDASRAPAGRHTAWGYCHVPNGSTFDRTAAIEAQMERFAPGFRVCVLARRTQTTTELESWDANLLGGDLSGGEMSWKQLLFRPTMRGYRTSDPALFLCSSSAAPGGGVHGMCGFHAAQLALR